MHISPNELPYSAVRQTCVGQRLELRLLSDTDPTLVSEPFSIDSFHSASVAPKLRSKKKKIRHLLRNFLCLLFTWSHTLMPQELPTPILISEPRFPSLQVCPGTIRPHRSEAAVFVNEQFPSRPHLNSVCTRVGYYVSVSL